MGNTKSRHALSGGSSRKHGKHSKHSSRNLDQFQSTSPFHPVSPVDAYPAQSALPYDSGHYSIGSMAHPVRPEFTSNSYHAPGRLDQQKKASNSSLRLQYGSRVKRAPLGANGVSSPLNNGSLKGTGASHSYMADHGLYNVNLPGGQEMTYQYQRGVDPWPASISPRHSLMSSYPQQHPLQHQQYGIPPAGFQPHQYHQHFRASSASPMPMHGDIMNGLDGRIPPSPLNPDAGRPSQEGIRYQHQQRPHQDYMEPSYNQQFQSSYQRKSMMGTTPGDPQRIMSDYAYANHRNNMYGNHMNAKLGGPTPIPRATDVLATAGPLVDCGPLSSDRQLGPEQVFARLLKQYPSNPHETEKRERVYRWQGHVIRSLTFNPDSSIPGWIIPVTPDELDHPERYFFFIF